ncbi:MAG: nucleotidyltransferase family protein [Burkholderiaceae bacterium]
MQRPPVIIVLASGRGERFAASGGTTHKLDALLAGRPVLEWTVEAARASGLQVDVLRAAHPGMGDTIARAVRNNAGAGGWLILPGDLPLVSSVSIRKVAQALEDCDVVLPTHEGRRGHPVGFSRRCGPYLEALEGDEGAAGVVKHFLALDGVRQLALEDEGICADVDTVEDLRRLEAKAAARR